jgi:hypothetical protein
VSLSGLEVADDPGREFLNSAQDRAARCGPGRRHRWSWCRSSVVRLGCPCNPGVEGRGDRLRPRPHLVPRGHEVPDDAPGKGDDPADPPGGHGDQGSGTASPPSN